MSGPVVDGEWLLVRGEIAAGCGVAPQAVSNWLRRHPDFPRPQMQDGREWFAVAEVAAWLDKRVIPEDARRAHEPRGVTFGDRLRAALGLSGARAASAAAPASAGRTDDDVDRARRMAASVWRWLDRLGPGIDPATLRDGIAGLLWLRWADPQGWLQVRRGVRDPDRALSAFTQVWAAAPGDMGPSPLEQSVPVSRWWARRLPAVISAIEDGLRAGAAAGARPAHSDPPGPEARLLDELLSRIAAVHGALEGEYLTPPGIAGLMTALARPGPGERVWDPCCGTGELLLAVAESRRVGSAGVGRPPGSAVVGRRAGEGSPDAGGALCGWAGGEHAWRVARFRLAAHGVHADLGPAPQDALERLGEVRGEWDVVVSNPPFRTPGPWPGGRLPAGEWPYGDPPATSSAFAWAQIAVRGLAPGGRCVLLMPSSANDSHSPREQAIRRALVQGRAVRAVIGLPGGLFQETRAPVSLWVLGRGEDAQREEVLFVDMTADVIGRDDGAPALDPMAIDRVVAGYLAGAGPHAATDSDPILPNQGSVAAVGLSGIASRGFSLRPQDYLAAGGLPARDAVADGVDGATERLLLALQRAADADADLLALLSGYR